MSELLPTLQSESIRRSLTDYLTTTFALTDAGAQAALDDFLSHPVNGMFKGPYVRLRMPYRLAGADMLGALSWDGGLTPYVHQAAAFARLASARDGVPRHPEPTLLTTGTGSGKTEAFLYPIIDHVLRARRQGVRGVKALILYPMNALANDQAGRLARLITGRPELAAVTGGLFTGEQGVKRRRVSQDGLITDHYEMRENPPDILLTNYKMLDQMLLRADDQDIWRASADSLQYLVLDEFHTYDGAQGTDVAMLLRRLGLALKRFATLSDDDLAQPLGKITPVATSATLGGTESMLTFAQTVFGMPFTPDSIVSESRQTPAEWLGDAPARAAALGLVPVNARQIRIGEVASSISALGDNPDPEHLTNVVLAWLYHRDSDPASLPAGAEEQEVALKAHPLVQKLAGVAVVAQPVDGLAGLVLGKSFTPSLAASGRDHDWEAFLEAVVAVLGHIRAGLGRGAASVEVHYWLRELTRLDRVADTAAEFRWSDDGPVLADDATADVRQAFPAIYCRRCGRSGWAVKMAPVGLDLAADQLTIRRDHAQQIGGVRALIHAPGEADAARRDGVAVQGLRWLSVKERRFLVERPGDNDPDMVNGWVLPVLTLAGDDDDADSKHDVCPSCGTPDAIRFLGSAVATLLSVSLSTLFGAPGLDNREKRALVFTDSVQDAAHRAGFVQSRAHAMTLRSILRQTLQGGELTLEDVIPEAVAQAGDDRSDRYRLLPPDCADRDSFTPFWDKPTLRSVPGTARNLVKQRLSFDAALEFGLNSRIGRTLELTGSVAVKVAAGPSARLAQIARDAISSAGWEALLDGTDGVPQPDQKALVAWVRGVLDRIRTQGGINHPWLDRFCLQDGPRYLIWGGRRRDQGMPAFPKDRPAPAFPRVATASSTSPKADGLDAVNNQQSWYAMWSAKALGIAPGDAARIVPQLLALLAKEQVLTEIVSVSGGRVYGIRPANIVLTPIPGDELGSGGHMLECSICKAVTPGSSETIDQLEGAPCLAIRCGGRLVRKPMAEGFYRRLYESSSIRRIIAREHTSLLDDETRLAYEAGFKNAGDNPQAPNVLVATPTLEMGIDIGDLSAVFLASLPRTVAAYTQRVGRAGRLTGNTLAMTYVTGRGEQLPRLGDPLSVIEGEVRPPATYLSAEEILRRQFTASLVDEFARQPSRPHPRRAAAALGQCEPGSFLGDLIELAERQGDEFDRFAGAFAMVDQHSITMLEEWVTPVEGPSSSPFAHRLARASQMWRKEVDAAQFRLRRLEQVLPELQAAAASPAATDDDRQALRSAEAGRRLTQGRLSHLSGEYWIAVLEEYGLLPNYTLLDETASLDVGMSWTDPETEQIQTDHMEFQRGSTLALREFAPGAQFYAHGMQIEVDAVDLGMDAEDVHPWAMCAACGYAQQLDVDEQTKPPAVCPRCGNVGIADAGQRLEVLELAHSTAEIRRDESMISDRDDERQRPWFEQFTTVDLDPAQLGRRWAEDIAGFSFSYYEHLTIRWINVGRPPTGATLTIAGNTRPARLFRVCEGCGKLDKDAGLNNPHEHRAWCPYRKQFDEQTRSIALSHTLNTQGIVLRLPPTITLSDEFAMPSLSAAISLGLREQIGGQPDHLAISAVRAPQPDGNGTVDALLIHDLVPGGTGYLTDWAEPRRMFGLLAGAWDVVANCDCQEVKRLACHKCLLPYASPWDVAYTSRAAAERHLATLLRITPDHPAPDFDQWALTENITTHEDSEAESVLEQRFRKVLMERLASIGANSVSEPGAYGNTVRITIPGTHRLWKLTPQVRLEGTRPDFVLESSDPNIPWIVIYTDGWAYHASPAHNRLADDAAKRADVRGLGHAVLAVTSADVGQAEANQLSPPLLDAGLVGQAQQEVALQASRQAYELLGVNPIEWLIAWVQDPDRANIAKADRAVPLAFGSAALPVTASADEPLEQIACRVLHDEAGPDDTELARTVRVWRQGSLAVAIEMLPAGPIAVAVVINDSDECLTENADAWRGWLRYANAMALRDWPTTVTTCSLVQQQRLDLAWLPHQGVEVIVDTVAHSSAEQDVLARLVDAGLVMLPKVGEEGPLGIPLDIAWPAQQVALAVDTMPQEDIDDLRQQGWTVLDPASDDLVQQLALVGIC